ncbi:MAG: hypothetical protein AAF489_09575 [Bacteroidota bacterium]
MKYAVILLVTLAISACKSQKNNNMNIPKINKTTEKFDTKVFESDPKSESVIKKINNKDVEVFINKRKNRYEERDSKGVTLVSFSKGSEPNSIISGYDYSENSTIGIYKEFYSNENIKTKGAYCKYGFKIGLWYSYNEKGELIETQDHDKGFAFGFEEVLSFCEKEKITLERKTSGYPVQIFKVNSAKEGTHWDINYPDFEKSVYVKIKLDGETGKVLGTSDSPLPGWVKDPSDN